MEEEIGQGEYMFISHILVAHHPHSPKLYLMCDITLFPGLILLRSISRGSFHHSYPHLSYTRFVLCNILRILFGYLFLLNLFITIVQADDVITIFFDVLALGRFNAYYRLISRNLALSKLDRTQITTHHFGQLFNRRGRVRSKAG